MRILTAFLIAAITMWGITVLRWRVWEEQDVVFWFLARNLSPRAERARWLAIILWIVGMIGFVVVALRR
jgi:hypothetical protein